MVSACVISSAAQSFLIIWDSRLSFCLHRASCDHIANLRSIDKSQITGLGEYSVPQATKLGKQLIRDFLFGSNAPVPNAFGVVGDTHEKYHDKVDKQFRYRVSDRQHYIDRCAFNLHTGSKPTDVSHKIVNGVEVAYDSHCSRSEYRFSLIDVLSGLHDDSVLYNRRFNQPSLATELHSADPRSSKSHQCFN